MSLCSGKQEKYPYCFGMLIFYFKTFFLVRYANFSTYQKISKFAPNDTIEIPALLWHATFLIKHYFFYLGTLFFSLIEIFEIGAEWSKNHLNIVALSPLFYIFVLLHGKSKVLFCWGFFVAKFGTTNKWFCFNKNHWLKSYFRHS